MMIFDRDIEGEDGAFPSSVASRNSPDLTVPPFASTVKGEAPNVRTGMTSVLRPFDIGSHFLCVAFFVHSVAIFVAFGCLQIDRFVADRADKAAGNTVASLISDWHYEDPPFPKKSDTPETVTSRRGGAMWN